MTAPTEPSVESPIDVAGRPVDVGTAPSRVSLDSLVVQDFRNLERVELAPPPEGFVVVGENGHTFVVGHSAYAVPAASKP